MSSLTKRRWLLPALGLALAIVAALAVYAFALAGGQRSMSGQINLIGGPNGEPCAADGYVILVEGTGTLSHLGSTTIVGSNCSRGSLETGPAVLFDGTATYTAADGSTVSVEYNGYNLTPVGTITDLLVSQTVTSGTGRFANASGEWIIKGTTDIESGEVVADVDGWISY